MNDQPKSEVRPDRKKGAGAYKPDGAPKHQKKKTQRDVDEALEDSFPASDPPSYNPGAAKKHG